MQSSHRRRRCSEPAASARFHESNASGLLVLAVLGALVLSACGWRLQGTTRLPQTAAEIYIDASDRYTDFNRALRDSLRAAGARITEHKEEATTVVRIIRDDAGERVLSVSARNTPEEYEVYYSVEYAVDSGQGELIAPQKLEVTRDYSYDVTAVLAKQREEAILREALARDLAAMVVRRIASL